MSLGRMKAWPLAAAVVRPNRTRHERAWLPAGALVVLCMTACATSIANAQSNLPPWPGVPVPAGTSGRGGSPSNGSSAAAPRAAAPFVLTVEQNVRLAPPEWDLLRVRELEARLINAPTDAARMATAQELEALRMRLAEDGAVVLLGRAAGARGSSVPTVVLVPAGLRGPTIAAGSAVRVTPSAADLPASALGLATNAFPMIRTSGTDALPGFVAAAVEPATAPSTSARAARATDPSPWAGALATSLAESASLSVEGSPVAGAEVSGRVPLRVTVRNSGPSALPPVEVFFEFLDGSGNLIHREFAWVTPQRSQALEAHLPALAPGATVNTEVAVPPAIAAQARSARVLILRELAAAPR